MLKKILWVLGFLFVAVVAALGIFLATFDADQYRPQLVERMEAALGKPVSMKRLKVGWRGGLGLQLQGLAILSDPQKRDLLLAVDSVHLAVPLKPLIRSLLSGQVARLTAQARMAAFGVTLPPMKSPVEALTLRAHLSQGDRLDLEQLWAKVAGGMVTASGKVEDLKTRRRSDLDLEIQRLSLSDLLPETGPGQPTLQGRFSLSFQGKAEGLMWEEVSRSLTGDGRIQLQEGVIANLNLLREVFSRLSVVPGLAELLQHRLPQSVRERWNARDTVLEPIDLAVTAGGGSFTFQNLRVATESFELVGQGRLGLEGTLDLNTMLRIEPALSEHLIRSVEELKVLTDSQGRLEIPVTLQGPLTRLSVQPDIQYVLSRMAATQVEDLLGGLLEKALGGQKE